MEKSNITVAVTAKMEIPEETARRCMALLNMYLDDHPELDIQCENLVTGDGYQRTLYFSKTKGKKHGKEI